MGGGDFQLLPVEAEAVSADEALDAAEQSAMEDPLAIEAQPVRPVPLGRTWRWDEERGRLMRGEGGAPIEVRGEETLQEWIRMTANINAGVHAIYPPHIGIENLDEYIGLADPREAVSDYEEELRTALVEGHERIAEVDEFEIDWDPAEGVLIIPAFDVILEDGEAVTIPSFPVQPEE